jgi:hypothetical protein
MSDLKINQMHKACSENLDLTLQSIIIDLIEEGYSEAEIKLFIQAKVEKSLEFLKEYVAL